MAITYYCIPADTSDNDITQEQRDRSNALGCMICKGDPSEKITIYPSVVVLSTAIDTVVFPDNQNQVTLAEVQEAELTATTAETNAVTNKTTNLASAHDKLVALGFTVDEVKALLGN
jgi:hypothetical protein